MEEPLPLDVLDRLNNDFGDQADKVAVFLLARRRIGNEDFLGDRLVRCVIHAACGDKQRLLKLVDLARQDFRDVIVAGEYDEAMRQVRDLRASFLIDSPDKFWAGEVAYLMASRGYRLAALETRSATTGPFEYMSDYGEGRARFIGPKGEVVIEKKDREWMVQGNRHQLEKAGLDRPFHDERAFHDAVSGFFSEAPKKGAASDRPGT